MNPRIYRFGECSIEPAARELRRAGELVVTSPKVFDCIAYLLEHRERAVGRDELVAAVWGRGDVSDTLLGQTIVKARRAIGDTGNEQRAIRTVPRFGYRWVADVEIDAAGAMPAQAPADATEADAAMPASASVPSVAEGTRRTRILAVILAIAVAAVVGAWLHFRNGDASPAPIATATAVAVLPVEVVADGEWSWVRLGLMDLIATRLHNAGVAVVPSENIVALLREADPDRSPSTLRAATGAASVLVPTATHLDSLWQVRLELRTGGGEARTVEGSGSDPVAAAHEAIDRLLVVLGRSAPQTRTGATPVDELLSQVKAALLADELATAQRLLDGAPPALRDAPELRLRRAEIDERSGRFQAAGEQLRALLDDVGEAADPVLRARIRNGLGRVAVRLERPAQAEQEFLAVIALLDGGRHAAELGRAYTGRGVAQALEGRYDQAGADFAQARIAFELAGDTLSLARVESNEAMLDIRRNHHAVALPMIERAIQRFEQFGIPNELPIALAAKIDIHLALLQPREALEASDRAGDRLRTLDTPARRFLDYQRVRALLANGRLAEGRALLDTLLAASTPQAHGAFWGQLAAQRAALDLADDRPVVALPTAQRAVEVLDGADYARERLQAWFVLARALRALGRDEEAAGQVRALAEWSERADNASVTLRAHWAQAEQAWAEQRRDEAWRQYETALHIAVREAVPADIAAVSAAYGGALLAAGEHERAGAVIGRAARWSDRDFASALLQAQLYRALGQEDAWRTALTRTRALAGERAIPADVLSPPG